MPSSFQELCEAKAHGFSLTVLLVQSYLRENGPTPVGLIARACDISERSVERSIAALKAKGLMPSFETTKKSHDHVTHGSIHKGTPTPLADPAATADPLARQLLAYEVLPWCVDALLAKVDRAVLTRQLQFHAHRLAAGFAFKGHPARYLFRACLNDYQPPAEFHETRHRERESLPPRKPAQPVAARPVDEPVAQMTREGALTTIRLGLRSRLPHMREEALRLAAVWEVDVAKLAVCG